MANPKIDDKLCDLAGQMKRAFAHETTEIRCPYCQTVNDFSGSEPPDLCCVTFGGAMGALLGRRMLQETIDVAMKAVDRNNGKVIIH